MHVNARVLCNAVIASAAYECIRTDDTGHGEPRLSKRMSLNEGCLALELRLAQHSLGYMRIGQCATTLLATLCYRHGAHAGCCKAPDYCAPRHSGERGLGL